MKNLKSYQSPVVEVYAVETIHQILAASTDIQFLENLQSEEVITDSEQIL